MTSDLELKRGGTGGGGWERWALGGILLFALVVRLGWGMSRPVTDAAIDVLPDQRDYLSLAQSVVHGSGLAFIDKRFGDVVKAFRTPGYPFFLVATGADIRAARAVQALVDTSTVLAVYLLAQALLRNRRLAGLVAAFIVAVNPYLIYFSGLLLSETLFTAMLTWGMLLLIYGRGGQAATWRKVFAWLGGGLILATSVLVRPSAIAMPVLLGWASLMVNRRGRGAYQKALGEASSARNRWPIPAGATMVGLTLIVLLPWGWRNFRELGSWIWLDTNSGFTLYDGYNPDATGASDQSFIAREPELQVLGEIGRSEYLRDKAWAYAREHPGQCVSLALAKLGRTWSPVTLSKEFGQTQYRLVAMAYSVPFDVLVFLGLMTAQLPRPAKILLLSPALYFSIVHALTVGSLRYRIPCEPPMAVLAAAFLVKRVGDGDTWRRSPDTQI